jgi:hypothetical protein
LTSHTQRVARRLLVAIVLVTGALGLSGTAAAASPFGPNVKIFDPSMSKSEI